MGAGSCAAMEACTTRPPGGIAHRAAGHRPAQRGSLPPFPSRCACGPAADGASPPPQHGSCPAPHTPTTRTPTPSTTWARGQPAHDPTSSTGVESTRLLPLTRGGCRDVISRSWPGRSTPIRKILSSRAWLGSPSVCTSVSETCRHPGASGCSWNGFSGWVNPWLDEDMGAVRTRATVITS